MAFWSGETLEARLGSEGIVRPFKKEKIDCAAYTLHMGAEAYITPDYRPGIVERMRKDLNAAKQIKILEPNEHFVIPAGQFAWLLTDEYVYVPEGVLGFISLRTTYKFKGLINVSGFHVDPGFKGKLVYAVYNAGPSEVRLAQGTDLFLIWFADLDKPSVRYSRDKEIQHHIKESFLVPGQIVSLQSLQDEIEKLRLSIYKISVWAAAIGGVAGFLLSLLRASK